MADLKIRFAKSEDVALILEFIQELAENQRLTNELVVTEADLKHTLFGERPLAEVLLAYLGEKPVGFALFFHTYASVLGRPGIFLEDLYVRPQTQGQGVGKALIAEIARVAQERGCIRLEWWVLNWNSDAIDFYRRLGAVSLDNWTIQRVTGAALDHIANQSHMN